MSEGARADRRMAIAIGREWTTFLEPAAALRAIEAHDAYFAETVESARWCPCLHGACEFAECVPCFVRRGGMDR